MQIALRNHRSIRTRYWRAIREGRLATVTNNVERILGRKPIALDQWAVEKAAAFR
jgi:hypothetical protein